MSHIYILSPSSSVLDKAAYKRGITRLMAQGHTLEIDQDVLSRSTRFAGDDMQRLSAIKRAAASGADVVMTTRGGYGISRLLGQLPYKAIAKSIDKGTEWVGFSDVTALSLAVMAQTGRSTWAGPALIEDFGRADADGGIDEITLACFDDVISGMAEGTGWRIGKDDPTEFGYQDLTLWGGNLSMVCSMVGTPYLPKVRSGALFLEDVAEPPYRVERMLTQLLHAGVLAQQKVIMLGAFNRFTASSQDKGFAMKTVVQWLRANTKARVLTQLPHGHVSTKVMLPVGKTVDVMVQAKEALVFWSHDHSDTHSS
jgi:muramoyltetrapeptide carboxypeptidase